MATGLDDLVDLLELEQLEDNLFRGLSPQNERERIFGGQVLAQGLMAMGRTVEPDRAVHSMHAYFLRPGDPRVPIIFDVDRIRNGRSFTTRRVVAIQHGEPIFNASASFHVHEDGPDHSDPMPEVAPPETITAIPHPWGFDESPNSASPWGADRPIDMRFPDGDPWWAQTARAPDQNMWLRANGTLHDDPLVHATVGAYVSDISLLGTATMPHWVPDSHGFMMASLDHVMWFHREFRADEWLLFNLHSPSAIGARGFSRGSVFRSDGRLAMSIAQEGLIRPIA